jgi:hypothetical protein
MQKCGSEALLRGGFERNKRVGTLLITVRRKVICRKAVYLCKGGSYQKAVESFQTESGQIETLSPSPTATHVLWHFRVTVCASSMCRLTIV